MTIPYPSNYFDPFGDEPTHAECRVCGVVFDIQDLTDLEEIDDPVERRILRYGTCWQCQVKQEKNDDQETQDP